MAHEIGTWRAVWGAEESGKRLAAGETGTELPLSEDIDLVVEMLRRYPGLSRALAEYLAR
jgi:hypothetical protein